MRFPWLTSKPTSRAPPQTSVSSFDRDSERRVAEKYSAGRQDWIEARYRLIDEVLEYRRTHVLAPSFLEACELEFKVASWAYSEGVRRLVQLAQDGHPAAIQRLNELQESKDWRVRYEALRSGFEYTTDRAQQCALVRRALNDKSARIRTRMASEALFGHLIEMVDELEAAALSEPKEEVGKEIFHSAFFLRSNDRTGVRGMISYDDADSRRCDEAFLKLRAKRGSITAA